MREDIGMQAMGLKVVAVTLRDLLSGVPGRLWGRAPCVERAERGGYLRAQVLLGFASKHNASMVPYVSDWLGPWPSIVFAPGANVRPSLCACPQVCTSVQESLAQTLW
jgi:hypothetical protein